MPGVNYNMIRKNNDGSHVEIRTKGQYENFLKRNGLVSMSPKEMLSIKPVSKNQDPYKQKRKEVVERVFKTIQKDGIECKKINKFLKDVLKVGQKGGNHHA